jgi:conjugal transfer pilus assembly protein TraL
MSDHVILNYQDQPLKFFVWPASSVAAVSVPVLLFILLGKPFLGLCIGVMIGGLIRFYKRHFGEGSFIGIMYWYLPHNSSGRLKITPPSHIREYIG